ncbi:hypothetical protein ACFP1I_01465 [Dyadobacter subterraneus]|uniref:Uncharacterized protein n=1 Tax=Dyadobacter subterraneus TaxID=2773304 RepID=A0ABR9WB07_9BACT|nr:hypothetical protein [Dyadobacter subterraneus]MBE9461419.1 hypothetical protein [Dyadobacter subterraneus]
MRTKQLSRAISAAVFAAALFLGSSSVFAQVKIGTNPTTIAAGSALEVEATDKGVRLPQVSLTSTIVFAPVAGTGTSATSPGMTVYNSNPAITSGTGSNGTLYPSRGIGVYYWDGFGWVTANATKGYQLIWAGHSSGPFNSPYLSPAIPLAANEYMDSFNSGSNGKFVAPYDAFYTVSQNCRIKYNGVSSAVIYGTFDTYINVKSAATGITEARSDVFLRNEFTFTYAFSQSVTIYLKAGDEISFSGQGCMGGGCQPGSNYDIIDLDQTVSLFQ